MLASIRPMVAPSLRRHFVRFLFCIMCSGLIAQEFRALISGVVRDPSGGAVPEATASITNVDTNLVVTVKSSTDGAYFIPQLPVGTYQLSVEAKGFKKYSRDGIVLELGAKAIADVRLEIGSTSDSVTVNEELTGIENSQSVLGQTLASKQMVDIAFGGRNFLNFMEFSAGVLGQDSISQSATDAGENNSGRDMNYEFQGGRPNAMLWTLDGASNGPQGGASFIPLEDAIQEMKVSTPISDASYGLSGGGVISVSTKSGTNQLHGAANDFLQNNALNAWTTQQKAAIEQSQAFKYRKTRDNVYAGMLTGPVIKNKLFYAGSYDGRQTRSATPTNASFPTLAQRTGNFSQTFNSAGQLDTIYDPLTTQQVGSNFVRTPFPGNIIPSNRINPISANILALEPAPNYISPNSPITNVNNYFIGDNPSSVSYQGLWAKGDYIWNEKNRTSAAWDHTGRTGYSATGNGILRPDPLITVNGDPIKRQHQGSRIDNVTIINPTTVLTVRAAWDFWEEKVYGTTQWGYNGNQLGFTGPTGLDGIGFPTFSFSGGPVTFAGFGNSQDDHRPKTDYELSGDLSKSVGKHFFRFGVRAAQIREGYEIRGNYLGALTVDAGFTQANPQQADATSGNSMASFLLGYPSGGNVANNLLLMFYMTQAGLYVQNDFRVTPKLMLNYGLRWDVQTPPRERFNRMDIGFDPTSTYQLGNATAQGNLLFANSKNNLPFNTQYGDIQPRFGIAYQLTKKLVFRGGAGMSYLPMDAYRSGTGIEDAGLTAGYSVNTPYVATNGGGASLYIPGLPGSSTLANPFPNGFLQPSGAALGPAALVGTGITVRDRDYKIPYVYLFQGGVQYALPFKSMLEASYVRSRTHRIAISQNIDYLPLAQRLMGVANPSYLTQSVPNPFYGAPQLAGTSLAAATITQGQALLPYPQFTGVTETAAPVGHSWYNSLEMRLTKQFSQGLTINLVYTFAKAMEATSYLEPQYTFLDRELSAWDRTHNLDIAASYYVPVGKGQRFFASKGPLFDKVIGNWQLNTSVIYLNGTPGNAECDSSSRSAAGRRPADSDSLLRHMHPAD
jgi:carboxypeptidase family protein